MNENNLIKIILKGQYVECLLFVLYFKSLIIVLMMSLCIIVMSSGFLNGESELHTMMHSSKEADTYQTRRIECFKRPNSYWWLKLENNFLFVLTKLGLGSAPKIKGTDTPNPAMMDRDAMEHHMRIQIRWTVCQLAMPYPLCTAWLDHLLFIKNELDPSTRCTSMDLVCLYHERKPYSDFAVVLDPNCEVFCLWIPEYQGNIHTKCPFKKSKKGTLLRT